MAVHILTGRIIKHNNQASNALIVRRIHKLEPRCRHIQLADELHTWWLENALPHLLPDNEHESISGIDPRHLREKAWNSVNLSAQRIVEIQKALRPIVRQYERYRMLETKLHEWCRSFLVVVGGSIGRFESESDSDADISIIVDSENFARCYEVIQGMIVWPLKLRLLENSIGREFSGEKLVTDRLVYCFDYRTVLPSSTNEKKFHYLRQLLTSGIPLHRVRTFKRYLAAYYADGPDLPGYELAAELAVETQNQIDKVKARDPSHPRFWRGWIKFVRLCMLSLALRHLPAREWGLNYFTLAELLYLRGVFSPDEWSTVREAISWALYLRGNSGQLPSSNGQLIAALKSFQSLSAVTENLLKS